MPGAMVDAPLEHSGMSGRKRWTHLDQMVGEGIVESEKPAVRSGSFATRPEDDTEDPLSVVVAESGPRLNPNK
jgi:hypothetical protein